MAWSLLNPIDTMVARCSSGILSVGVVPGPELEPGNTKGAEKSAANRKNGSYDKSELERLKVYILAFNLCMHLPGSPMCTITQFIAESMPVLPV